MSIRCIAFDLDDTLWECKPVIERAEQVFYTWLQAHYPRIPAAYTPKELIQNRQAYMQNYPDLQYNLTLLRKNWIASLADSHAYDHAIVEAGFEVFWRARNAVTLFDGTLDTLNRLAEKFVLGVISNGNASVDYIGIGHLFRFVHSAAEAGVAKPHPAIFEQALASVFLTPDQAVYVGDDPIRDIQGAAAAGWKTVWFNPQRKPWSGDTKPDAIVADLRELETILTSL